MASAEKAFPPDEARRFGEAMAAEGYPAVHHSKEFNARYRPAYRVIAREFLAGLVPGQ